jgi:peptidoglycan/xylan/chitin deacetylase (PgdA/CDA1 family)
VKISLVLCYHAVSPTWTAALSVTQGALERQLTALSRRGWTAVTFCEAALAPPSSRTLAVTFDDAFLSVATLARPVLDSLGMPATVFAPSAFMAQRQTLAWSGIDHWQQTPHAGELESMSWRDLGELAEGGWEIGSHTRTHPYLTQLDDDALAAELEESRREICTELGHPCATIAYPYGNVDVRVANAAQRAGYLAGAGLGRRLVALGPYRFPRIGVYHDDPGWRFRLKTSATARRLRALRLGGEERSAAGVAVG